MRRYTMPSIEPEFQLADRVLERLIDVSPRDALPMRHVSTVPPHKPGVMHVTGHETEAQTQISHLRHLYDVRTRPHLYYDDDVETTVDGWYRIARDAGQFLYDCVPCKVTWPIAGDADTCPVGHPILED